ncbi:hypothetical protein LXL04_012514 [Taraxacum kok-saghyz]
MKKSMDESKRAVQIQRNMAGAGGNLKEKQGSSPVPERNRLEYPVKPKWQIFTFGFGSSKFPTKMKMSDIKIRQLRQQTATTITEERDDESDLKSSQKKRWWRLIDIVRCGGGYDGDTGANDIRASFPTLKKFD